MTDCILPGAASSRQPDPCRKTYPLGALGLFRLSLRQGQPARRVARCVLTPRRGRTPHRGRTPRRGRRGLIGILLSIVVVVAIIIAVFAIYNQVTASSRAAQTAVFVRQLAPQITSQYRGNYDGFDNAAAISSGFIPDNWRNGTNIEGPDGATVVVTGGTNTFTIIFTGGVATQTCKAVLGALKTDRTFGRVLFGATGKPRNLVDTPAKINDECGASPNGNFELQFR